MRSEASVFPHIGAIFLLLAPCVHPCLCAEGAALAFLQGPGCVTEPGESTLFRALLGSWGNSASSLLPPHPPASGLRGSWKGCRGSWQHTTGWGRPCPPRALHTGLLSGVQPIALPPWPPTLRGPLGCVWAPSPWAGGSWRP